MPDTEAEKAIREAIGDLAQNGDPINGSTVPKAAIDRLLGEAPPSNEATRVYDAINDMAARGDLIAPAEPWKEWSLP